MHLRDASILIAGASGGIGSALAKQLGAAGSRLTVVGRDPGRLDQLDVNGVRVAADLRDPGAARASIDRAVAAHGRVDAVVNCVGVVAFGPVDSLTDDTLEELFLTNVFVDVFLARAAMSVLDPGGVLVSISGVISEGNLPGMAAYGASKSAVRSFRAGLAREARRKGVRVVDARPPHTETGLADRAIAGSPPRFPDGLDPKHVAAVIANAIADDSVEDLPSTAFGSRSASEGRPTG